MKPIVPMLVISLGIAALAGYALYAGNAGEGNELLMSIFGGLAIYSSLVGICGFRFERDENTLNLRVISFLYLVVSIGVNVVFSLVDVSDPVYIITSGILLLIYAAAANAIIKANV